MLVGAMFLLKQTINRSYVLEFGERCFSNGPASRREYWGVILCSQTPECIYKDTESQRKLSKPQGTDFRSCYTLCRVSLDVFLLSRGCSLLQGLFPSLTVPIFHRGVLLSLQPRITVTAALCSISVLFTCCHRSTDRRGELQPQQWWLCSEVPDGARDGPVHLPHRL